MKKISAQSIGLSVVVVAAAVTLAVIANQWAGDVHKAQIRLDVTRLSETILNELARQIYIQRAMGKDAHYPEGDITAIAIANRAYISVTETGSKEQAKPDRTNNQLLFGDAKVRVLNAAGVPRIVFSGLSSWACDGIPNTECSAN